MQNTQKKIILSGIISIVCDYRSFSDYVEHSCYSGKSRSEVYNNWMAGVKKCPTRIKHNSAKTYPWPVMVESEQGLENSIEIGRTKEQQQPPWR